MYEFDKRLHALADCPVIWGKSGAMAFNPNPIITAENDFILSHEICHILAGRDDFEIFITALRARNNNEIFRLVLNLLYDQYHESLHGKYSGVLYSRLNELHKLTSYEYKPTGLKILDDLSADYFGRSHVSGRYGVVVKDVVDLIVIADIIVEEILPQQIKTFGLAMTDIMAFIGLDSKKGKNKKSKMGGPKSDIDRLPERSNYYISAVSRHFHIINELANLWKKNKYGWVNNYYGEIDFKNLQGMFLGEKLSLPVWKLFQRIAISRKIYLVIDRSGSTEDIKEIIMDTAVIIAESLRMLDIPISILDIGITDSVVNDIESPLDMPWFTPMARGRTPLGEVCSLVKETSMDSYMLIITDGEPNNWDSLISALNAFSGKNLTFVIGDSYGEYISHIENAIHVEPHTIIREMLNEATLT